MPGLVKAGTAVASLKANSDAAPALSSAPDIDANRQTEPASG
jgi:hypothetical protein